MLSRSFDRRSFLKGALATTPLVLVGPAALRAQPAQIASIGPSTTTEPYLLPSVPGVTTVSILTVGDSIRGHRMVGIPDGLGAFRRHGSEITLFMNHEIPANAPGIVRAHGSNGAFVSRWTIDRRTLEVLELEDHTQSPNDVHLWDQATQRYVTGTTQWQRLCSADLAAESAFSAHGLGTDDRLFLDGEEVTEGRAWARIASGPHTGEAWQLPRLGRMAFENAVASPYSGNKTVVVCLDDSALSTAPVATSFPSEVYVYIGTKTRSGSAIDRAGLTNGELYGMKLAVGSRQVFEESNEFGLGDATTGYVGAGRFTLQNLGDVSNLSALQLEQASIAAGVARLQRVEDGAWDPRRRRRDDFYFVTTASLTTNSRLWRLRFDDVERPERGGTIEILLRGDEGHRMLDNVTIDRRGRILMDEDPGNNPRISKVWLYGIATGQLIQVAAHNPKFFDPTIPGNPSFITQDEESSGIIDAGHLLGRGWFLLDVQVHKASSDPELVEGGQLLAMFVDPAIGHDGADDEDDEEDDR
jgi:hypothetical protein